VVLNALRPASSPPLLSDEFEKHNRRNKAPVTAGSHKLIVLFYQHGGEKALQVNYAGPDIEKKQIPNKNLSK
jgi:hypothetical protein